MQIREILVNLDIDGFSSELVSCAVDLARRFDAGLIGHTAAEPATVTMGYGGSAAVGVLFEHEQHEIGAQLAQVEDQFRAAVPNDIPIQWRGGVEHPNLSLAKAARCADLIVTSSNFGVTNRNPQRSTDIGELVVKAGRPVLILGVGLSKVRAERVVVGWKDCREARRAVADALPLLQSGKQVQVATIHEGNLAAEKASLTDVLTWMRRHGIEPVGDIHPETPGGAAEALEAIATDGGSDLIVTGGYGHSRMREHLFGGMTRDLLSDRSVHRFMSN